MSMATTPPDPYEGKLDIEVLQIARTALSKGQTYPRGSANSRLQVAIFDTAMNELSRRMLNRALDKLREE